jgi:uncharacterized protein YigE (DUF2233 family)
MCATALAFQTMDSRIVLAISDEPVNFHHFARLFRDELGDTERGFISTVSDLAPARSRDRAIRLSAFRSARSSAWST